MQIYVQVNDLFSDCRTSTKKLLVSLGRQNLEGKNPNEVSRHVAAIIVHPDFDRGTINNDIALVRLSSPVNFSHYIRPVCLAASASVFNNGTGSWVTGWGYIKEGGKPTLTIYSILARAGLKCVSF